MDSMNTSNIHGWVLWITSENEENSWGIHRIYESFDEANKVSLSLEVDLWKKAFINPL